MRAIAKFVAAEVFGRSVLCRFDDRTKPGGAANGQDGKFNVRYRTYAICINVSRLSRPQIYFSPGIQATMPRYGKGLHNDGRIFAAQREDTSQHVI